MSEQYLKVNMSIQIPEDMILITKVEYEQLKSKDKNIDPMGEVKKENGCITKRYLNQKEVCKYTGKAPSTINEWVKRGLKIIIPEEGSRPIYDVKDVDAFLEMYKTKETKPYKQNQKN